MAHELGLDSDEGERLVSPLQTLGLGAVQLDTPLPEDILAHKERLAQWRTQLETAAFPLAALGDIAILLLQMR